MQDEPMDKDDISARQDKAAAICGEVDNNTHDEKNSSHDDTDFMKSGEQARGERMGGDEVNSASDTKRYMEMLLRSNAELAAARLGIAPERVDYAIKLCDFNAISCSDRDAILSEMQRVVADIPEAFGLQPLDAVKNISGTGSMGVFARRRRDAQKDLAQSFRKGARIDGT